MNEAIVLPDGSRIEATPGKYRVVPPPDLNEVEGGRFLLEYEFPFLIVRGMSTRSASDEEQGAASLQARLWVLQHPRINAKVGGCRLGYQFNAPRRRQGRCYHRQFIPDISYVEKNMGYLPCVPAVVIELMSATDRMEDLQAKVTKFINAGTREGVVVDTRGDRVWIYNRNEQPYFDSLAEIQFDSWPDFTLDCIAIRDARTRLRLR
ncbi:TPA: hypothetical protein N0F65_010359 [Lagenidium giganteum]|uniref:Putative restriction endonuclease domain-containing protein n=1 Tax=Lagenidium giganteum TaxID=4803 RepID=A0AAV2Z2W2_9STRA|nr:TPA: hypothetical protein N0F65_006464 [Lagenidium giganteum]DBA01708.1 TPA: hypothetical protein N0F65_010359 [Lagenidium giganteum]